MPQPDAPIEPIRSEFASDPDMTELIDMFLQEMPDRIEAIAGALREDRLTELRTIAHQLKGAGAGYGFEPISYVAGRLETTLNSGYKDLDAIRNEVSSLIDVCRRAAP